MGDADWELSEVAWGEHWPDAMIGGLSLARIVVLGGYPEDGPKPSPWRLSAEPAPGPGAKFAVVGDLSVVHDNWFCNVVGVARVELRSDEESDTESEEALDELLDKYGLWASHPLWDFCRANLLQATASFAFTTQLEVPALTPNAVLVTQEMKQRMNEAANGGADV